MEGLRVDEEALLMSYLTTFELPADAGMEAVLAAFARVAEAGQAEAGQAQASAVRQVSVRTTGAWDLRADVMTPPGRGPHPVLVYLHGGGWTTGTPAGYRVVSRGFADRGFLVVTPDYRRAPRHRFPAGLDDCRFAIDWASAHAGELGGLPGALVVAGDSAGANLAAAALVAGEMSVSVAAALLFYGIYDLHAALPRVGSIVGRPTAAGQLYLPVEEFERLRGDLRVSPLGGARRLPPTFLAAGADDPLLSETEALAGALAGPGRSDVYERFADAPHGFLQLPFHPSSSRGFDRAARFARQHLPASTWRPGSGQDRRDHGHGDDD